MNFELNRSIRMQAGAERKVKMTLVLQRIELKCNAVVYWGRLEASAQTAH